ncbi:hypothetical protein ACFLZJ_02055, partial [Nanoarchaeota archaeon]
GHRKLMSEYVLEPSNHFVAEVTYDKSGRPSEIFLTSKQRSELNSLDTTKVPVMSILGFSRTHGEQVIEAQGLAAYFIDD